jgi:hypothetical protein
MGIPRAPRGLLDAIQGRSRSLDEIHEPRRWLRAQISVRVTIVSLSHNLSVSRTPACGHLSYSLDLLPATRITNLCIQRLPKTTWVSILGMGVQLHPTTMLFSAVDRFVCLACLDLQFLTVGRMSPRSLNAMAATFSDAE